MPIIYALVARATSQSCCVLAEHTTTSGNFTTVTRRILEKVPEKSGSYSYIYDKVYLFHIIRADGLLYVCLADEGFGKRIPFAFLEDIKSSFVATYGDSGREALAYAMNENFGPVLQRQIVRRSSIEYCTPMCINDRNRSTIQPTLVQTKLERLKGRLTR
mmetsp:Transcript_49804/g.128136  ORF Transcript_49804/g.128136 Transcript_49804/m.128136 type:complete len:160 (-) Transcript_49804:729-1208(-)